MKNKIVLLLILLSAFKVNYAQENKIGDAVKLIRASKYSATNLNNGVSTLLRTNGAGEIVPFDNAINGYTIEIVNNIPTWVPKYNQVQADWNVSDPTSKAFILNKPTINVYDGSETKLEVGNGLFLFGTGTIADPYVIEMSDLPAEVDPIFSTHAASDVTTTLINNWTAAYNKKINSIAVSGTTNKTITLTQQDGSTLIATFTDIDNNTIADGSETKLTGASNITITGLGTIASPYVISNNYSAPAETDPVWLAQKSGYYTKTNLQTSGQSSVHWDNIINTPTFLTTETDPIFISHAAFDITSVLIGNWNNAYSKKITAAAFSGTSSKTLTLTQQDGSTITAAFTDLQGSGGGNLQQTTDLGNRTTNNIAVKGVSTNHLSADTTAADEYEIVIFPDIQNMVKNRPAHSRTMFQWLADNYVSSNVKAMMHTGDITDWTTTAEWDTASAQFSLIDAIDLPYITAIGNHDYNGTSAVARNATLFNQYFGASRFSGKTWFGGNYNGGNENSYISFNAGTKKYFVIALEFLPRDAVLTWAGGVLDSLYAVDPDREVIVLTHAYQTAFGELAVDSSSGSGNSYGMSADNSGQEMWDKLIKKKRNIKWVISGHSLIPSSWPKHGLSDRITAVGEHGNLIQQIYVNYQDDTEWGNGYMMRLKFKPSTGSVDASYYSSLYDALDPRKSGYTMHNSIDVKASIGVAGDGAIGGDFRVAGELKVETLERYNVPYVDADHVLKDTSAFQFNPLSGLTVTNGKIVNKYGVSGLAIGTNVLNANSFTANNSVALGTNVFNAMTHQGNNIGIGKEVLMSNTNNATNNMLAGIALARWTNSTFSNNAIYASFSGNFINGSVIGNVWMGFDAGEGIGNGSNNTYIGYNSGHGNSNTGWINNNVTLIGAYTLAYNVNGVENTTVLGNNITVSESNRSYIGNSTQILNIPNLVDTDQRMMVVNPNGDVIALPLPGGTASTELPWSQVYRTIETEISTSAYTTAVTTTSTTAGVYYVSSTATVNSQVGSSTITARLITSTGTVIAATHFQINAEGFGTVTLTGIADLTAAQDVRMELLSDGTTGVYINSATQLSDNEDKATSIKMFRIASSNQ